MTPKTDGPHLSPLARLWHAPAWAVLLAIVVLGGALRFYQVGAVPPGLYQDEAYNGLDALNILAGSHPIYFPANNGREPFYMYAAAASVAAFGRTPLALRFPSAVVGTLLIAATFALGRALFNQRVGLFAAAGLAITFWPLALSHIGLRAGSLPLFSAVALACAAWGWRMPRGQNRLRWLVLGGVFYGLTYYTYLAARFTLFALIAFLILWYIAQPAKFPTRQELAAFVLPAILVVLPLAVDALWQPEILLSRVGDVSILSPTINHGDLWGTLFHNLLAGAGMFILRGDTIARHNLPGRPVFDPILALAFVAGLALTLLGAWRRKPAAALVLVWTTTMLLPTILAEDTPHFLRAVGVLPVVFIIPALALDAIWQRTDQAAGWQRWALPLVVVAGLAGSLAWTVYDYFGRYANSPDTAYLFQTAAADLAQSANSYLQGGSGRKVLLDQRFWNGFTSIQFLLPVQPGLELFREGQILAPAQAPFELFAWPYEDVRPALQALPAGFLIRPEAGPLYRGDLERKTYPLYSLYTVEASCPASLCPSQPLAVFGGAFQLLSAVARTGAAGLNLQLVWRGTKADSGPHQVFAQAWAGGKIVAQADGPLGTTLYPSEWWRPGETVLETRVFNWPRDEGFTGVTIRVGIYDVKTGIRLSRTDSSLDYFQFAP